MITPMMMRWILFLCVLAASLAEPNISTVGFTGMSCPRTLRMTKPDHYCVTKHGLPQRGCRVYAGDSVYLYAFHVDISESIIPDCFRVEWFWRYEIYFS